jgi:hypothetical protein
MDQTGVNPDSYADTIQTLAQLHNLHGRQHRHCPKAGDKSCLDKAQGLLTLKILSHLYDLAITFLGSNINCKAPKGLLLELKGSGACADEVESH